MAPLAELVKDPLPNAVAVVSLRDYVANGVTLPEGAARVAITVDGTESEAEVETLKVCEYTPVLSILLGIHLHVGAINFYRINESLDVLHMEIGSFPKPSMNMFSQCQSHRDSQAMGSRRDSQAPLEPLELQSCHNIPTRCFSLSLLATDE